MTRRIVNTTRNITNDSSRSTRVNNTTKSSQLANLVRPELVARGQRHDWERFYSNGSPLPVNRVTVQVLRQGGQWNLPIMLHNGQLPRRGVFTCVAKLF